MDGRRVHPAPAAVQQHRVPVAEAAQHEQVEVRGHVGLAHARRLLPRERLGNAHQVAFVGARELGVSPARHQRHHPVAGTEALDPGTHLAHHARHLESQDLRLARGRRVLPFPLADVRSIHRGRHHLDEHLARPGLRQRGIAPAQHPGVSETVHQHGLHGVSLGQVPSPWALFAQPPRSPPSDLTGLPGRIILSEAALPCDTA